jgi:transposase
MPRPFSSSAGTSKERRPDLKQLVYSLCVTADGAVPVHFKAYDGNQTDDGIVFSILYALLDPFDYRECQRLCARPDPT